MSNKTRLDVLLVEQGLQESRQKAQATIMAGIVYVNNQKVDKPGTAVPNDAHIEVRGKTLRYVSRGGLKLEKAMQVWPITLEGKTCADIGSSTGGFTDCMLQNGAAKVYAVDVGTNQLAWKLRTIFRESVVSVEAAQNIVVLKTIEGMAQGAAFALDNMGDTDIVGTLAGDDTIFLVFHDTIQALDFCEQVKQMLR